MLALTGETEKENLKELALLRKLANEKGKSSSVEESRKIQTQMETLSNQRSKLTALASLLLLPEAEHEDWAQNLKTHGLYTSLETPDTERYPWTKMPDLDEIRHAPSGAELAKKEKELSLFLWPRSLDAYPPNTSLPIRSTRSSTSPSAITTSLPSGE